MTLYTPNDAFADVNYYDISDLVLGGPTGPSSQPIEQLADRTQYLYNRLGGYKDVLAVGSSGAISAAAANMLVAVTAAANVTLTLAAANTFVNGNRIAFTCVMGGSGPFWLNIVTPDSFIKGSVTRTNIWLYDGEFIEIVCAGSAWHWTINDTNYSKGIGEVELKRFQPKNTVLGNGNSGLLRATYPRIWEAVNTVTVADSTWLSDAFRYRQQYSAGNGSTTFRLPDYRAMFFRALDGSRGVDLGRFDNTAGGYEADDNKAHNHAVTDPGHRHSVTGLNKGAGNGSNVVGVELGSLSQNTSIQTTGISIGNTGATEARGKNVGFNPYIFY